MTKIKTNSDIKQFLIFRCSDNHNSFGLRGYWLMNVDNGEVWEVGRTISFNDWQNWSVINVKMSPDGTPNWAEMNCELPTKQETMPEVVRQAVLKEAEQHNSKSKKLKPTVTITKQLLNDLLQLSFARGWDYAEMALKTTLSPACVKSLSVTAKEKFASFITKYTKYISKNLKEDKT